MKLINRFTSLFSFSSKKNEVDKSIMDAHRYQHIFSVGFDGEKTPGEIGDPRNYWLDHPVLRARSWQSYLESEITQNIMRKYIVWVIGKGIKLKSEPIDALLPEGFNRERFVQQVEARFRVFSKLKVSRDKKRTLVDLEKEAFKNCKIAGDVLVILRVENKSLNIQLVDADHVVSPDNRDITKGHRVRHGVETNKKGEVVAYWVSSLTNDLKDVKIQRIKARDNQGRLRAYLVFGNNFRLDNMRGLPLMSAVLETLKKLDRYKEATVASAEERAKVALVIEHDKNSTGENHYKRNIIAGLNLGDKIKNRQNTDNYRVSDPNKIAETAQKQIHNLPVGASLKAIGSETNETNFKDFYSSNFGIVCTTVGLPPEVARSEYNSNYSASRAALKDWENVLEVERDDYGSQFIKPIFSLWLENEILLDNIQAPGYISSKLSKDEAQIEAYEHCRFVGKKVPHLDPVKEVAAERAKLGDLAKVAPLTTLEQATENVSEGDYDSNVEQFKKEIKSAPKQETPPAPKPPRE